MKARSTELFLEILKTLHLSSTSEFPDEASWMRGKLLQDLKNKFSLPQSTGSTQDGLDE